MQLSSIELRTLVAAQIASGLVGHVAPDAPQAKIDEVVQLAVLSQVFAGQAVGVREVADHIWLISFMHYDLGFFDHETCRIESAENPFAAKVLPMSPV